MKRRFIPGFLFIFILVVTGCNVNSGPRTYETRPTRSWAGINLGNALDAPQEGDWGVVLEEEYFTIISKAGFHYVRIPIRWSTHAGENSPYTIDTLFMYRVIWAVNLSLENNLIPIINIHHYEEIMTDPSAHKSRFLGLWTQIADTFKDFPEDLYFEILNEPNNELTPALWNEYLADAITVIRQTNPDRTLVVGTASWGGIGGLADLILPPEDPHIIVTFHYYNPFEFTHQGAEWVDGSDAWMGTTWTNTPAQELAVRDDLDTAADWGTTHGRTMFLGEFGAYSKADIASRAAWTRFVAREAESRGIFWTYWEFCAGFGAFNSSTGEWNSTLLDALIPPEK
ncbi:MAG: glycoside hydrolase family 5 protein [Spirochaetales bacterium]|nr:glycoside hydrolase family 5 protein [Spirochaetales bacterium]